MMIDNDVDSLMVDQETEESFRRDHQSFLDQQPQLSCPPSASPVDQTIGITLDNLSHQHLHQQIIHPDQLQQQPQQQLTSLHQLDSQQLQNQ